MPSQVTIAKGDGYRLDSIGNGWAYELVNPANDTQWFQDDDGRDLRAEWEALESAKPETDTGVLLAEMWERYA